MKDQQGSIRSGVAWQIAGNVVYIATQAVIFIVLGALGDLEDVGLYALATAVTAPVFLLVDMNLRVAIASDGGARRHLDRYLRIRVLTTAIGVAVCGLLVALGFQVAILAAAIAKGVESFSTLLYGILEADSKAERTAQSMVERSLTGLAGFVAAYIVFGSVSAGFLGLAAGWALEVGLRTLPAALEASAPEWAKKGEPPTLRGLTSSAGQLGLAQFFYSLTSMLPRVLLERTAGTAALGIFASVAYLTQGVLPLAIALGVTILPRLSQYREQQKRAAFSALLNRAALMLTGACVVGAGVAAALGPWVIESLFGERPDRWIIVAVFVSIGATLVQRIYARAVQAAQRFRLFLLLDLVSFVVALAVTYPLVSQYEALGAAIALAAAYTASLITTKLVLPGVMSTMFTTPSAEEAVDTTMKLGTEQ